MVASDGLYHLFVEAKIFFYVSCTWFEQATIYFVAYSNYTVQFKEIQLDYNYFSA